MRVDEPNLDLLQGSPASAMTSAPQVQLACGPLARRAVILGAGLAGLATACAVAAFFEEVVVLETDDLTRGSGHRPGTPQARHSHALLAGGVQALEELSPGIRAHLVQAGAVVLKEGLEVLRERPGSIHLPQRDLGVEFTCLSRSLLEAVLRERVERLRNVTLHSRCRVRSLHADSSHRVRSVLFDPFDGASLQMTGDLFIDATGHGSPTLNLLNTSGLPSPTEEIVAVDMGLVTAVYNIPENPPEEWKALITLPALPANRRGALILPIEGNQWSITCYGRFESKPEPTLDGIHECLQHLRTPTAQKALALERPASSIWRGAFPQSRRRNFSHLPKYFHNLLPIGDTICRFNPQYGQGMSVAALQSRLLKQLLHNITVEQSANGLDGLAAKFPVSADGIIEVPWSFATTTDFADPRTSGTPPANHEEARKRMATLTQLAADDASVHRLLTEVQHLLRSPSSMQSLVA